MRQPNENIDCSCPQNLPGAPPRDIICCLPDYPLKEEISFKARGKNDLIYQEAQIQIFQDLSPITIQNRKDVCPLLKILRDKGINYR